MIAVDSNVLVRLLAQDDAAQYARVADLMGEAADASLFVSDVVLCELAWVLTRRYGHSRVALAAGMRSLLKARQLAFEDPTRLSRALGAFEVGAGDLADYVIREHALAAGCGAVATFDRALLKEPGFRAP